MDGICPFKVLSLFTGIGGMDMGFVERVIVHKKSIYQNEWIEKTYEEIEDFVMLKHQPYQIVFMNDILVGAKDVWALNSDVDSSLYNTCSIFDLIETAYEFPKNDVIIGGFPCQDFSHCGKRNGFQSTKSHDLISQTNDKNNRGTLFKSFVKVVELTKPKIFVAENVYGLLTMKNDPILQIIKDFEAIGYTVAYQVVYCPDFGIPQKRKRVIIMGILNDRKNIQLHTNWNILTKNQCSCYVGHYLSHLSEPDETVDLSQQLYSKAKKLDNGQGQKEIALSSFAPTMRAEHHGNIEFRRHQNTIINPSEQHLPERRLTIREAGLIQTFPPKYVFTFKKNMTAYKYIGNAVPPLLGYIIADHVKELLKNYF
jgi:DNA (cytosine-5)-methyltransferase 1